MDFDADGDGRLSRDEAPLLLKAQFERWDTDGVERELGEVVQRRIRVLAQVP